MRALYIIYPGKVMVREVQKDNLGAIPPVVKVMVNRFRKKDKDGNYIPDQEIVMELTLKGHEIKAVDRYGLQVAYWPESWMDSWGDEEVDRYLRNETQRKMNSAR